jgi:FkbM family methyltransferase
MILFELDKSYTGPRKSYIKDFSEKFISDNDTPKYVFGNTCYSRSIMEHIKIDGIIEDNPQEESFNGTPMTTLDKIAKNSLIVICCTNVRTAIQKILHFDISYLDYIAFFNHNKSSIPLMDLSWNVGFEDCYTNNIEEIYKIYNNLCDKESREVFAKIINFRLSYEIEYMKDFTNNEANQYFEPFLNLSKSDEIFIDIGGYDGYTSLEFIKKCPKYKSVHIFEPIPSNSKYCHDNLKNFNNIFHYDIALADEKKDLYFCEKGSGSTPSKDGAIKVKTDRLDDVLPKDIVPTLIKFDIEGGELKAIKGLRNIIKEHHPRLAISIYHRAEDFHKIPHEVLSIRSDYTLYVRHYGEGIDETVMFFIPKREA